MSSFVFIFVPMKVFVLRMIDDDHTFVRGVFSTNNLAMSRGQEVVHNANELKRKGNPFGGGVYDLPEDPDVHAAYDLWLDRYIAAEGITGYVINSFEIDG
jgi:hypothetical protein